MASEASQCLTSRSWKLECSLPSRGAAACGIGADEDWTLAPDGLIAQSLGHYDEAEYQRQLKEGASSPND